MVRLYYRSCIARLSHPVINSQLASSVNHTNLITSTTASQPSSVTKANMALDDEFSVSELTEYTENLESHPVPRNERKRSDARGEDEPAKRKRGNKALWAHTRPPKDGEPLRNKHKQEIYYCGQPHCTYSGTPNSSRFRAHLSSKHNIVMKGAPPGAQTIANQATINDIFGREGERQRERDIQQEKALVSAIPLPEFNEACARLIAIRNHPHTLLDWPEFWAVIHSVNYMGKDMIRVCRKDVP
ncbi:hypothetical protein BGZ61DRAFT_466290 [Ilyonectria robusta]|uniref:uncharacterized protein n=1 Tax=Ilyonectria robusta TaxID=1079257 RepID=UPI001E8D6AD8|nr:uncharacterized protein BGZ61DRAFT_466290 [Ilyonectria robusta]KAH8656747.1 hypothetical protein BGZ61DRAFT_466290 [Ilyonectria robusta]